MAAQGNVDSEIKQWLIRVDQNLSLEGFLLLKVLYLNDVPYATLSDRVRQPHDLFLAPSDDERNGKRNENVGDIDIHESPKISSHDSLSLFVHRLRVLVPSKSTELRISKDVGAQKCLDLLPQNLTGTSRSPGVADAQESKLLECLVKTYVNLTLQQRLVVMRSLADSLEKSAGSFTAFQLFEAFFHDYKKRPEAGVALFSHALQQVKCPAACAELEDNLTNCGIPHYKIQMPDADDFEDDVSHVKMPLLGTRSIQRKSAAKRAIKVVCACLCLTVPVVIGLALCAIGMGVLYAQTPPPPATETYEASSYPQPVCPFKQLSSASPISLGNFNTFWQNSIQASQAGSYTFDSPMQMDFYLIQESQLRVHNKSDWCSCQPSDSNGCDDFGMEYWYLLNGSSFDFSVTFTRESDDFDGYLKVTIYDSYYNFEIDNYTVTFSMTIDAYSWFPTKTLDGSYVVPSDGYYFMESEWRSATIDSYQLHVLKRFLNASDWVGTKPVASLTTSDDYTMILNNKDLKIMAESIDYTIVGNPVLTWSYKQSAGRLNISQQQQKLVYTLPAIASGTFILLGLVLAAGVLLCCYGFSRATQRHHERSRELHNPINV